MDEIYLVVFVALIVLLFFLQPSVKRPELTQCLDAISRAPLRRDAANTESTQFVNGYCSILYWRHQMSPKILMEKARLNVSGLIGVGRGTIDISWRNGAATRWEHSGRVLPQMTISENYIANTILGYIHGAYHTFHPRDAA